VNYERLKPAAWLAAFGICFAIAAHVGLLLDLSKRAATTGILGIAIAVLLATHLGFAGWIRWMVRSAVEKRRQRNGSAPHRSRADSPQVPIGTSPLPPIWLRNAHVQSVLGSSRWRKRRGAQALHATGAITTEHLLDGGSGIRLQGFHSTRPGTPPRGLVVLMHGWEGSADSGYMRFTAAQLLADGFDVFRLNFRDHGNTHHLNAELFLFSELNEVLCAVADLARRFPCLPLFAAGYSLGGNFALRLALSAPAADISLRHVAAVCPLLDPIKGMEALEHGLPIYYRYFMRKWRASLRKKRSLFPDLHTYDDTALARDMLSLTRDLVFPHSGFTTLQDFFSSYSLTGRRLSQLQIPVSILAAADDPVIPVSEFRELSLPDHSCLEITTWGGHCGFIMDSSLAGLAERWISAACSSSRALQPNGR
jgi:predicted alpha/beta-fold hydrolase